MFGLPILSFIAFQMDVTVVGKVMPIALLGLYSMAIKLSQIPSTLFAKTFNPVLLSAFAEKQDDKETLSAAVLKITKAVAFVGLPFVAFMNVGAKSILSVVYGATYTEVAIPFGLLSLCMLFSIESYVLALIYLAIGQPQLHRRYVMVLSLVILSLIYPAVKLFGLVGSAAVVLLANVVALCAQVLWMRKPIGLGLRDYVYSWIPGLCLVPIVLVPSVLLHVFKLESVRLNLFAGGLSFLVVCIIFLFSGVSWKHISFFRAQ